MGPMPRTGVTCPLAPWVQAPRRLLPLGAPHSILPPAGAALGQAGRKWPAVRQDRPGALMFLSQGRACVAQRRMQLAVLFWCQHPRPPDGGPAGQAGARNTLLCHPPPVTEGEPPGVTRTWLSEVPRTWRLTAEDVGACKASLVLLHAV